MANICIIGAGYVGGVTAAGFAKLGYKVTAIDINNKKVELIENGQSPIMEPGLNELVKEVRDKGLLRAMQADDYNIPWNLFNYIFICVATPSSRSGKQDLSGIHTALEKISNMNVSCPVIIRSTLLPDAVQYFENIYKNKLNIFVNPEFIRETKAVEDFFHPPYSVIGGEDKEVCRKISSLYDSINCKIFILDIPEACLVKYSSNAFHALKITFANEIGAICKEMGADALKTLELVCSDTILNISSKYLRPGFAFGGSCLPKDLRVLTGACGKALKTPMLSNILSSNEEIIARTVSEIDDLSITHVGFIGVSFKAGTDDLRESPYLELARRLIGLGYKVEIYDPDVNLNDLTGSNLAFASRLRKLHLYMRNDIKPLLKKCEALVICKQLLTKKQIHFMKNREIPILDLENSYPKLKHDSNNLIVHDFIKNETEIHVTRFL